MGQQAGDWIKTWRQEQGLSLNRLAQLSGIHKSTLSRWEAGKRQPSLPELDAVLAALHASPAQKRTVLHSLDAPRAVQCLREMSGLTVFTGGDLLRAMRLRSGKTQADAAAGVGVRQSTFARWERGDECPSTECVLKVCYGLNATEAEIAALSRGSIWLNAGEGTETPSRETLAQRYNTLALTSNDEPLRDLGFLSLASDLLRTQPDTAFGRHLLGCVYARHTLYLLEGGRPKEAVALLPRLKSVRYDPAVYGYPLLINALARARVYGQRVPNARRGVSLLLAALEQIPWAAYQTRQQEHRTWLMSELAEYLMLAGRDEEALATARQSCQIASEGVMPVDYRHRLQTAARLMLQAGRAEETLEYVRRASDETEPSLKARLLLLEAQAWNALDNPTAGHRTACQVLTLLPPAHFSLLRLQAETLVSSVSGIENYSL